MRRHVASGRFRPGHYAELWQPQIDTAVAKMEETRRALAASEAASDAMRQAAIGTVLQRWADLVSARLRTSRKVMCGTGRAMARQNQRRLD